MSQDNTLARHLGRDRIAENVWSRRPRTPGAGNREHPVRVAENTWYRSRRPRTPGAGNREHPVRIAEDIRPSQSSEDTQSPDLSDFRSSRCSIYTRNFARYFLPSFDNSEPAAPRTDTPKRDERERERERDREREIRKERDRA